MTLILIRNMKLSERLPRLKLQKGISTY